MYDQTGKLRLDLIPPEWEEALAGALGAGCDGRKGYPERGWEEGAPYMEHFASARRHMLAWLKGEDIDEETGQPHLALAAWRCLAIDALSKRGVGEDNRPCKGKVVYKATEVFDVRERHERDRQRRSGDKS